MGAVRKFSNSEQTVPSLNAIPHGVWMAMSVLELLCSGCLILPAFSRGNADLFRIAYLFRLRGGSIFELKTPN
jgi:hypothetical protein